MEKKNAIERLINTAERKLGIWKRLRRKTWILLRQIQRERNYTKYWRDVKPEYQGQPWCAALSWLRYLIGRLEGKTPRSS